MRKSNAVQFRAVLSAAAICAVLAAATFSGAPRGGSLSIRTAQETEPILVKSISTIMKPDVKIDGAGPSRDRIQPPRMTSASR
jgi:hypothetical protein